jgi:hypothetical protein
MLVLSHFYACVDAPRQRGLRALVARVVLRGKPPKCRLVAIVDGGRVIARAKGKDVGDALIGEFFVAPEEGGDKH